MHGTTVVATASHLVLGHLRKAFSIIFKYFSIHFMKEILKRMWGGVMSN